MAKRKNYGHRKRVARVSRRLPQQRTASLQRMVVKPLERLPRREFKRIIVGTPAHPKQGVREQSVKRGTLRITLQPTECRMRKQYKKKMLKSIAAQIKRSGRDMSSWRKQRAARRRIIYRC